MYSPLNQSLLEAIKDMQEGRPAEDRFASLLMQPVFELVRWFYINREDAHEAVSVIVMKLIRKVNEFDTSRKPMSYIRFVAKNHCIDEYRQKKSRKKRELTARTSSRYEGAVDMTNLDGLLEEIYGQHKDIIRMKFVEGKTIPTIMKELSLPRKVVSYQVQMAFLNAKNHLLEK